MPLSNFVPRGFGFVRHSIAILYHQVPDPDITIRNFFIASQLLLWVAYVTKTGREQLTPVPFGPGTKRVETNSLGITSEPPRAAGARPTRVRIVGRAGTCARTASLPRRAAPPVSRGNV